MSRTPERGGIPPRWIAAALLGLGVGAALGSLAAAERPAPRSDHLRSEPEREPVRVDCPGEIERWEQVDRLRDELARVEGEVAAAR